MTGRRRDMDDLRGEIQELFADLWQVPGFTGLRHGFRPQCDCFRTDDPPTLHVVVELPGVDQETIAVAATGRALTIAGRRERPQTPAARYYSMEIEYGAFQRRIDLGEDVDSAGAIATYERGMLKIVLPVVNTSTDEGPLPIEWKRR
jgi:HSP20 family molecular chaperone IbpA